MAITILENTEFTRVIQIQTGTRLMLSADETYSAIKVDVLSGDKRISIGYFEFDQPEDCPGHAYRLAYMNLGQGSLKYKREGIGRAILEFFIDLTGAKLICEPPGGPENEQGTNVTDEGIPFVTKMKKEGLIWFKEDEADDDF